MSPAGGRRIDRIQPFQVMALLAKARALEAQGRDIVHMEVGEPDFVTPRPIIDVGIRALNEGAVHYTPALGLPALREALAGYYQQQYRVTVPAERIVITPGASGALLLALGVLLEPGQGVMLADPGYPCNRNFAYFLDAEVQAVPVGPDTRYQLSADLVAQHWRDNTRVVMIASPSNPTGSLIPRAELQAILEWVKRRQAHVIMDEIYHGLVYGDPALTALADSDQVFVINSFSKYFGMTGWRLGWLVAPDTACADLDKLAQNLFLAASTPAQHAALAAFAPETRAILEQRRDEFRQRRDYLLPALRELGFDLPIAPDGAFYLYAGCARFSDNSLQFATSLLDAIGVAITPGNDFGTYQANTHLRFAYTTSLERLQEGVARLRAYLEKQASM